MWKKEAKRNFAVFLKAGLPYTVAGMVVVFAGLYSLKHVFEQSRYLTVILFGWLALFWFIYQPLFRRRIQKVKDDLKRAGRI